MPHKHQDHQPEQNWVLFGFTAVAALFLLTKHAAQVMGALTYPLLRPDH